jgi:cupin 2 domain-containing protein
MVRQLSDPMGILANFFAGLPRNLPGEFLPRCLEAAHVRIVRIGSHGHGSPEGFWYDQDRHEWVIVLKGTARLRFEDKTVEIKPGDFVN